MRLVSRLTSAVRVPLLLSLLASTTVGCVDSTKVTADPDPADPTGEAPIHPSAVIDPGPRFANGAVAADSAMASDAGVEILKAGGNAVDAAIATALTLSVTRPYSCGLGGGGFMLVFDPASGESIALDFRETSPAGVGPDYYVSLPPTASGYDPSRFGGRAVAVPGQLPGMVAAHDRFGSLPLPRLVEPAVRAARDGFRVDANHLAAVESVRRTRAGHPDLRPTSRWVWNRLCGGGELEIGDVVRQPELANFLERFGREGLDAWSGPDGAADLVAGVDRAYDGVLQPADLRDYRVAWRPPLIIRNAFDGHDAILMPPPSSGGIAIAQVLSMMRHRLPSAGDPAPGSVAYSHLLTESMRHAFADRARHLADADFVEVPVDALLDPAAVEIAADRIELDAVMPVEACGVIDAEGPADRLRDAGTSHFSVIDDEGMTVACTQTINGSFGSLLAVPRLGIVLNNEMNDFTTIPGEANLFGLRQSDRNLPEPGKRPLSSMSPTILVKDGRTTMTAGASGGPKIITGTLQVILEVLQGGRSATDAVNASRLHHQWNPDTLRLEAGLLELRPGLEATGHTVEEIGGVGVVQAIVVHEDGFEPASDPRKGGRPAGW
ncbi:MAG: gamma-glutamyltransferase [Phycisphaerales bacterium]|nr:gamma-glutamyltransferase [Phycisphaerales bacterium]